VEAGFEQSDVLFGDASPQPNRSETGFNATSMAIAGGRIALAGKYVARMAADGRPIAFRSRSEDPPTDPTHGTNADSSPDKHFTTPCSAALSPDAKWLISRLPVAYVCTTTRCNGVVRLPFEQDAALSSMFGGQLTCRMMPGR